MWVGLLRVFRCECLLQENMMIPSLFVEQKLVTPLDLLLSSSSLIVTSKNLLIVQIRVLGLNTTWIQTMMLREVYRVHVIYEKMKV